MANSSTTAGPSTSIQGIVFYPIGPYVVICLVLLIVGCFQWGAFFHTKLNSRPRSVRDEPSVQSTHRTGNLCDLPLAVVNYYRVLAFRTTVGFRTYVLTLAELFSVIAYVALLFVWTFVIRSDPDGEPLNWCSRAGLLAASQFLFVTVLGTKNNVVSLVTHISADKLNFVHRLAARACLICTVLHALGGDNNFSFYERASSESEMFGIIAALVFVGLAIASFRPVRERVYELFFYLHLVAVIVIMVATILHINTYSRATSFTYYIWPSFVVWATDRLIRTGRLVYFNLAYFSSGRGPGMLDATTELLSDNLARFAYLVMPSVSLLPFEAHPFSIASVDSVLFAPDTKKAEDSCGKELIFYIGIKNGFTRRLRDVAARGERVKVYIDGPYGGVNLGCYNTSLLIAGGTGITFALPALLSIIESVRNGTSCCRRAVLIWSIRDADFLNWVSESLTKAIRFTPPGLRVDIQVFLTKSQPHLSSATLENQINIETVPSNPFEDQSPFVDPPNLSGVTERTTSTPQWVKVASGRPNLEYIIDEEINTTRGKMVISVCGPNAMAEVVRNALRRPWSSPSSPLNGGPSVTLHTECFGYA